MGHGLTESVAFCADAGPGQGLGHIVRSSAVANALRVRGIKPRTAALGASAPTTVDGIDWAPAETPPNAEVVVLDSYTVDARAVGDARLVLMHDAATAPASAALVVAPSDPGESTAERLCGMRFACLRPAFWGLPVRSVQSDVTQVLVTTGGGDPGGTGRALAATARDALPRAKVQLVVGPHAEHEPLEGVEPLRANPLVDALLRADVVVCGGGQTMLEAAACGTPCVALVLAENQRAQATALASEGAVELADVDTLGSAIGRLDHERRRALSERAQASVDGYGALRVAFRIAELAS